MTITRASFDGVDAAHAAGPDDTIDLTPARPLVESQAAFALFQKGAAWRDSIR